MYDVVTPCEKVRGKEKIKSAVSRMVYVYVLRVCNGSKWKGRQWKGTLYFRWIISLKVIIVLLPEWNRTTLELLLRPMAVYIHNSSGRVWLVLPDEAYVYHYSLICLQTCQQIEFTSLKIIVKICEIWCDNWACLFRIIWKFCPLSKFNGSNFKPGAIVVCSIET